MRKIVSTVATAMILCAPGAAQAATFVEYAFSGSGWATIVEQFDEPEWHQTVRDSEVQFNGSFIVNIDYPGGLTWGSAAGDTLHLYSYFYDRYSIENFATVNFKPGTLNGMLPTSLGSDSLVSGTMDFHRGSHYEGAWGTGTLHSFTATVVSAPPDYAGSAFNLTVTPVPEPATWAMMILGFGAIGAAMRSAKLRQKLSVSYV